MKMRIGTAGLEIIKDFEKLRLQTYLPTPNDVPTIGYGHTRGVTWGMVITVEEAEEFLLSDCISAENCVNREVLMPLRQNQFDALVSLVFNIGNRAFVNSTLCRYLNLGKYEEAAEQFPRWNRQGVEVLSGLSRRRARERELFLK